MKVNDIINVTVTKVHPSYVKVNYEGNEATLQITELTWRAGKLDSSDFVKEGQVVRVKVIAVEGQTFSVSLREASLGGSPWNEPPIKNSEYFSPIVRIAEYGYYVELAYYCHALLLIDNTPNKYQIGDRVKVKVCSVNTERKQVEVVLA